MFRQAKLADAPLLLAWRKQAEQADHWTGTPVTPTRHLAWLRARVANPVIQLLIWEENGKPAGMVRIDSNGELAFHAQTDATAVAMLQAAARRYMGEYGGRLKASVDETDTRTWRLLEQAGFVTHPDVRFLTCRR